MATTITVNDDFIDALAEAIASRINVNGNGAVAEAEAEEADDFGTDAPKEITLTDVQESIREGVGKHGKDKIKAMLKKIAGVERMAEIPKDKYQAVMDGVKKVK